MARATTNPHFQLYEHEETQRLMDDLVAETIEVAGWDMYYMPRRRVDFDDIFYEDAQSKFDTAYQIPLYIKSWQGFEGSDALMTQFGIEVQLQLILTMARIHWEEMGRNHLSKRKRCWRVSTTRRGFDLYSKPGLSRI